MNIGTKVITEQNGNFYRGKIVGKHGEADYYAVRLEGYGKLKSAELVYKYGDELSISYDGRATELIPGKTYRATCMDGQKVKVICVYNFDTGIAPSGNANVDFLYCGNIYVGASHQFFDC